MAIDTCSCGSGLYPEAIFDGHGIYLCRACEVCGPERLKGFRPDIMERYDHDEPLDDD